MGKGNTDRKKPSNEQIEEFLEEFRSCCRPRVDIEPRPEFLNFLSSRNLIHENAEDIILNELNAEHYNNGPEADYNERFPAGEIWKFQIEKYDTKIYIKLKLYHDKLGTLRSKCLSFKD